MSAFSRFFNDRLILFTTSKGNLPVLVNLYAYSVRRQSGLRRALVTLGLPRKRSYCAKSSPLELTCVERKRFIKQLIASIPSCLKYNSATAIKQTFIWLAALRMNSSNERLDEHEPSKLGHFDIWFVSDEDLHVVLMQYPHACD